jgi:hypothetical protein
MTDHAELRRIAEEATPSPWTVRCGTKACCVPEIPIDDIGGISREDARHIATWHPARALVALAVIRAARTLLVTGQGTPELRAALAAWEELE